VKAHLQNQKYTRLNKLSLEKETFIIHMADFRFFKDTYYKNSKNLFGSILICREESIMHPLKPTSLSHLVGLVDVDAPLSQLCPQDVLIAAEVDVLRTFQADAAAREHRL
jgi:hypothetical protein